MLTYVGLSYFDMIHVVHITGQAQDKLPIR